MKPLTRKSGQGMTEYIIIIAIIAIGAILIIGIFGTQIKGVFSGIGAALAGKDLQNLDQSTALDTEAKDVQDMGDFDEQDQN